MTKVDATMSQNGNLCMSMIKVNLKAAEIADVDAFRKLS